MPDITCKSLLSRFEVRFQSGTKRSRSSSERRSLRFEIFRKKCETDTGAFKNLMSEVERVACLRQDDDQSNNTMCAFLSTAVEGIKWSPHPLSKQSEDKDFPKVVDAIADSIAKFDLFKSSRQLHLSNNLEEQSISYNREIYFSDEDMKEEENHEWADFFGCRFSYLHRKPALMKIMNRARLVCFKCFKQSC